MTVTVQMNPSAPMVSQILVACAESPHRNDEEPAQVVADLMMATLITAAAIGMTKTDDLKAMIDAGAEKASAAAEMFMGSGGR